MVVEVVARDEFAGEFGAAGMAGSAGVECLVAGEMVDSRIGFGGAAVRRRRGGSLSGMSVLPGVVGSHWAVAGFTPDAHFGHGGVVGVVVFEIVLSKACIVTGGAHAVPGHAAAGPMTPF